jgi:hypothetical protein
MLVENSNINKYILAKLFSNGSILTWLMIILNLYVESNNGFDWSGFALVNFLN